MHYISGHGESAGYALYFWTEGVLFHPKVDDPPLLHRLLAVPGLLPCGLPAPFKLGDLQKDVQDWVLKSLLAQPWSSIGHQRNILASIFHQVSPLLPLNTVLFNPRGWWKTPLDFVIFYIFACLLPGWLCCDCKHTKNCHRNKYFIKCFNPQWNLITNSLLRLPLNSQSSSMYWSNSQTNIKVKIFFWLSSIWLNMWTHLSRWDFGWSWL